MLTEIVMKKFSDAVLRLRIMTDSCMLMAS